MANFPMILVCKCDDNLCGVQTSSSCAFYLCNCFLCSVQEVADFLQIFFIYLRNCMRSHLMTVWVQVLHLTVIGPLVRDVKSGGDWTTIGIDAVTLEEILVQLLVQIVHRVVEGQQHDLRHLLDRHVDWTVDEWNKWWWWKRKCKKGMQVARWEKKWNKKLVSKDERKEIKRRRKKNIAK